MSSGADRPSKKDRQSAARDKARAMREEAQRKARRTRWIWQGSIGVAVLAVIAVIVIVIANSSVAPASKAGPANMISNGIVLTSTTDYVKTAAVADGSKPTDTKTTDDGKIHIVLYEDLQCPYCREFEIGGTAAGDTGNDDQLEKWLDAGKITLEIHPIAFLDNSSLGNKYSTRAANAMAAVAQYAPDKFWAANKALYEDQPAESTKGKTDAQILATLKGAGVSSSDITTAVHDQTFRGWTKAATELLVKDNQTFVVPNTGGQKFSGTPTVVVDGKIMPAPPTTSAGWGDPNLFLAFVKSASGKDPNAAG